MHKVSQLLASLLIGLTILSSCGNEEASTTKEIDVKRVGMVIKIKPAFIDEYKKLHAPDNHGVRDLLSEANMRNFSIFLHQLDDGNWYEFGWVEMEQVYYNK
jgi:hypothetical protein